MGRTVAVVVLLVSLAVAGCSDGGGGGGDGGGSDTLPSDAPDLEATATTGVLRGVVVDDAIRPLQNVAVSIRGPAERNMTTGENGFFGFDGLPPGTYFVTASKIAHETVQQSVDVVAGVDDPPVQRILLTFVPSEAPFYTEMNVNGFIACIVPQANLCFVLNFYPCLVLQTVGQQCTGNLTNDNSVFTFYDPVVDAQRVPDWTQVEMIWDSTQPVTDWLTIRYSPWNPELGPAGVDTDRDITTSGPSPILATLNQTLAQEWELGVVNGFRFETFSGGNDLTCGGLPVRACTGFQYNQQVDYYFHFFFGYAPPEGWRFSESQSVPPPPA